MGFSITLQAFSKGNIAKFQRSIAWDYFGSHAHSSPQGFDLWYDGKYSGALDIDGDDQIEGLSLTRPSDAALTDFYAIARRVPSLMMWDTGCAVADPAFVAGLPDWLLNAFKKPPAVAQSAGELSQYIAHV